MEEGRRAGGEDGDPPGARETAGDHRFTKDILTVGDRSIQLIVFWSRIEKLYDRGSAWLRGAGDGR
jgi:hypothetical protein